MRPDERYIADGLTALVRHLAETARQQREQDRGQASARGRELAARREAVLAEGRARLARAPQRAEEAAE